jgi:hypothetical protein
VFRNKGKTKNGSTNNKGGKIRTWSEKIEKMEEGYRLGKLTHAYGP